MFRLYRFGLGKLLKDLGIEIKSFERLSTDFLEDGKYVEGLLHLKDGTKAKYIYETTKAPNRLIQEIEHNGTKVRLVTNKEEIANDMLSTKTFGRVTQGKELQQAFVHKHVAMPREYALGNSFKRRRILDEYHGETYTINQDGSIFALPKDNGVWENGHYLPIGYTKHDLPHTYEAGSNPYKILTNLYR